MIFFKNRTDVYNSGQFRVGMPKSRCPGFFSILSFRSSNLRVYFDGRFKPARLNRPALDLLSRIGLSRMTL